MARRKRDEGNIYIYIYIYVYKETTRDERLAVRSLRVEEQFVTSSRRLMEQIRTLSNQLDAMDVANCRCRQPTPRSHMLPRVISTRGQL